MGERVRSLIPGLPDDIALDCLARVPHQHLPGLRPVARRWRSLVTAPSFRRHRETIGAAEDLVFMVQALVTANQKTDAVPATVEPEPPSTGEDKDQTKSDAYCSPPLYGLTLYNATRDSWHRVAAPAAVPLFAQSAAVGDKLVLAGGWDPATFDSVPDVQVLDFATGAWRRGAPMSAARSFFACAAVGGKVYVAGGHDGQKNALRSAEVYDIVSNGWAALPPMADERDECRGAAGRGRRFWAVSGYGTEHQGQFDASAEIYDPVTGEWSKEEGMLVDGEAEGGGGGGAAAAASPTAAFFAVGRGGEERLWCVDCGGGGGRREVRELEGKGWRTVAVVPEELKSSVCATVMGGGKRVLVTGADGAGGHGTWVLEVGSGRWRKVETPPGFTGFVYSAAALRL